MNEYKIKVNLERGLIINPDIHLVQNDYNSTTFNFEFDNDSYEEYTKIFQLQYPDGTIWKKEIKDNKVTLANFDEEGSPVSILIQTGKYYFDIAVYDNDSKLTTTEKVYFNVREEITGEDIELDDRLPVLDDLINTVNKNLNETDNLDVDIEDTTITITRKDGSKKTTNLPPGPKGEPGAVKMQFLNQLPETGSEDTLYFIPKNDPTEEDRYNEYAWANNDWEFLGSPKVVIDLTDYQKKSELEQKDLLVTYEDETTETVKLVVYK